MVETAVFREIQAGPEISAWNDFSVFSHCRFGIFRHVHVIYKTVGRYSAVFLLGNVCLASISGFTAQFPYSCLETCC